MHLPDERITGNLLKPDLENCDCNHPFCFYTKGHDICFWNIENYPLKKVYGFPTRVDLERYSYIRKARKNLASELINTNIAGGDYQIRSIRAVMEAMEIRRTKFLLVMATRHRQGAYLHRPGGCPDARGMGGKGLVSCRPCCAA